MRIIVLTLMSIFIFFIGTAAGYIFAPKIGTTKQALEQIQLNPKPLNRYSIPGLQNFLPESGQINIEKKLNETDDYNSYLIDFKFNPGQKNDDIKKTTGLINIPKNVDKTALIVLIRGYVDQSIYETGMGTSRVGEYLAQNGYITISLDYLGYGGSDSESANIFETRFQTYTTTLALLKTLKKEGLPSNIQNLWDNKIGIWAHSNGGQIALTTLAVTKQTIPTVLWAPVTKPFPYSVLYYTDESADEGYFIRKELSKFESLYLASEFSFTNYLEKISAPIQIHQGTADDAVPEDWSSEFANKLKTKDIEVEYLVYPGADHNLMPTWNDTVSKTLEFFNSKLKNN